MQKHKFNILIIEIILREKIDQVLIKRIKFLIPRERKVNLESNPVYD